ncbi:MAG: ACP S-malonyltransferase [Cellvibrionaceae bacterium]|nr:ACP S-malonyltransferase [Cellvibrionaceae bacterium]
MKTIVFPGQGSQSKGMGAELFKKYPGLMEKSNNILGYSIEDVCLNNPNGNLNKTEYTQPALYVVNALSYYEKLESIVEKPDYFAGHSLGEYNALLAAECFDFETGLKLVKKRGELMSKAPKGAMAAILNSSKEEIEITLEKNNLLEIDLANYNTLSQIVISGDAEQISQAQAFFQEGQTLYYPLNTSGAFHSRFMKPAREEFKKYLNEFSFNDPCTKVISNVTAQPYEPGCVVENLSSQLSSGVRWYESIFYLMKLSPSMSFEEVGNGEVLSKMIAHLEEDYTNQVSSGQVTIRMDSSQKYSGSATGSSDHTDSEKKFEKASGSIAQVEKIQEWMSASTIQPQSETANEKVKKWNSSLPVGSVVKSTMKDYGELKTRTQAIILFGHRAAVYMEGYKGYFDLDELTPVHKKI